MTSDDVVHEERIRRLEELTEQLSGSPQDPLPSVVEYSVDGGIAFGFACLNEKNISVQRVILSGGSRFPRHIHAVNEWLILYEGRLEVHTNGKVVELGPADSIMFPVGQPHATSVLENTRLLAVTVPPDSAYPDVD